MDESTPVKRRQARLRQRSRREKSQKGPWTASFRGRTVGAEESDPDESATAEDSDSSSEESAGRSAFFPENSSEEEENALADAEYASPYSPSPSLQDDVAEEVETGNFPEISLEPVSPNQSEADGVEHPPREVNEDGGAGQGADDDDEQPDPDPGPPDPPQVHDQDAPGPVIDAEWFANSLVHVKTHCEVSDTAIQKILDIFMPNLREIGNMLEMGQITSNFRHGIKTKATWYCPPIWCAVKVLKTRPNGTTTIIRREGLQCVPKKYVSSESNGYLLLCQTCYTTIPHMKQHFESLHPYITGNVLTETYNTAYCGIDGVKESNSGPRSLLVVSVMLAGCILCWRIMNYLHGVAGGKPNLEELLRSVIY